MNTPALSILIPFKNEQSRLPNTLAEIFTYTQIHVPNVEIILVDDGSTDNSVAAIAPYLTHSNVRLITHEVNQGKGAAIRSGVFAAQGELILFSDADLATPIEELRPLIAALNKFTCDIAIASRALPDSIITSPQPWPRVLMGKAGNLFIRAATGMPFTDTQCGFKLFTRTAARDLFAIQHFPRWSFDIEVLYKAAQKGYAVCEVPVSWHDVAGSKVRPMRDALQTLIDVMRIVYIYKT